MGLPIVQSRMRRNLILLAAAGFSGYAAYKVYNLPAVVERRRKLVRLLNALALLADSVSSSADVVSLVASDLKFFLRSDSDEIPRSIRQIAKIAASDEVVESVSIVSEAVTAGTVRAFQGGVGGTMPDFSERVLNKVLSSSGAGFVSVLAGSFARGLVMGIYSSESSTKSGGLEVDGDEGLPRWAHLVCAERSRQMISDCIRRFVETAVAVYLEKTRNVNTYDDMFSGLTHPKHEAKMRDLLVSVCNGAVETFVRTSHDLMMRSKVSSVSDGEECCKVGEGLGSTHGDGGGWFDKLSSTLAVPGNRTFVLDLTGRVTFDTVRSFLEFMFGRLRDGARSSACVFHQEIVRRGLEMVRYVSAKTMLILTICLSFCLHLMPGTKLLVPA